MKAELAGKTALITWAAPEGLANPIVGYELFIDKNEPLKLSSETLRHEIPSLDPGSAHYVQVVAVTAAGQSRPAGQSFSVPYDKPAPPTAAPAAPKPAPPASTTVGQQAPAAQPPAQTPAAAGGTGVNQPSGQLGPFTATGEFHMTRATMNKNDPTDCDDLRGYYVVQVLEEHGAYEDDARLASSGTLLHVSDFPEGKAYTCIYEYTVQLTGESVVYDFKLIQHRAGTVEDQQKMTTTRLRKGDRVILSAY